MIKTKFFKHILTSCIKFLLDHRPDNLPSISAKIIFILLLELGTLWAVWQSGDIASPYLYALCIPLILAAYYFGPAGGCSAGIIAGFLLGPFPALIGYQEAGLAEHHWTPGLFFLGITGLGVGTLFLVLKNRLKRTESRWEYALQGTIDGVWDWNIKEDVFYYSKRFKHLLGKKPERVGKNIHLFHNLVHPDDLERLERYLQKNLLGFEKKRKARLDLDVRIKARKARYIWVRIRGTVVKYDNAGRPLRAIGTIININKEKINTRILEDMKTKLTIESRQIRKSRDDLKASNEAKEKFISIISHDLKNPFSIILGLSRELVDNYQALKDEQRLKFLSIINDSARSAFTLLENLLEWSRITSGKIQLFPQSIDVATLFHEAFGILKRHAEIKEINVHFEGNESLYIYADWYMISTALRNLLSNALKFTPRGGEIVVRAASRGESSTEITVKDSGIGMSGEKIKQLFVPGNSVSTSGTEGEPGTGIGLILCREFIERNRGTIKIESEPGKGSTFTLVLPAGEKDHSNPL